MGDGRFARRLREAAHRIAQVLGADADQELKSSVLRRVSEKVAVEVLRSRLTSWDPIHLSSLRVAADWGELNLPLTRDILDEIALRLLRGHVVPLQKVLEDVRAARALYLGRCVCRAAGRVSDLHSADVEEELVYSLVEPGESRELAKGLAVAFNALPDRKRRDAIHPDLCASLVELTSDLDDDTTADPLGRFWEKTWPYYEILLDHPDYTGAWMQSMAANDKVWKVPVEVLEPWVIAQYQARGAVFTSMALVDSRYTICTCPGPENDRGCLLFNWHYFSGAEEMVVHNTTRRPGIRRDEQGLPLPCRRFEERSRRDCLGCGCVHEEEPDRG